MNSIPMNPTEEVRSYVEKTAVEPARRQGRQEFAVVAGDVHKALGFSNRVPLVCQALRSRHLLTSNGLELVSQSGPPSGLSTTMVFTYRFTSNAPGAQRKQSSLRALAGIGKDLWKDWGGGERFLQNERAQFNGKDEE